MDASGNVIAGGGSSSNDTVSNDDLPNANLIFIGSDSSFLWGKQLPSDYDYVQVTKFNPAGDKILVIPAFKAVPSSTPSLVLIIDSGGNPLNSYKLQDSLNAGVKILTKQDCALFGSAFLSIAMKSASNKFKIVMYPYPVSTNLATWDVNSLNNGQATVITANANDQVIFAGGVESISGTNNKAVISAYNSLNGNSKWTRIFTQTGTSDYFYVAKLHYLSLGSSSQLLGAMDNTGSSNGIGFFVISMDSADDFLSINTFKLDAAEEVNCIQIFQHSSTQFYIYLYYAGSPTSKFGTLDASNLASVQLTLQDLPISGGKLNYAKFLSDTQSYYGGLQTDGITQITPTKYFINQVGFVMSYDLAQSCLVYTYSPSSPQQLTAGVFTFSSASLSLTTSAYTIEAMPASVSDLASLDLVNNKWCSDRQSITSYPISTQVYTLGDPMIPVILTEFTIAGSCSDLDWTYFANKTDGTSDSWQGVVIFSKNPSTMKIESWNLDLDGVYDIIVYGVLPNEQNETTVFQITVIDPCPGVVVTAGPATQLYLEYDLWSNTKIDIDSTEDWTKDMPVCPLGFFIIDTDTNALADEIFKYDGGTKKVTVQTTKGDLSKIKVYNLKLIGTSKFKEKPTYAEDYVEFTVEVFDICPTTVISTNHITFEQEYDIWQMTPAVLGITDWTQLHTQCPDIQYELQDSTTGLAADSIFTISGSDITVDTQNPSKVGTYKLQLYGSVTTQSGAVYYTSEVVLFEVKVFDSCNSSPISAAPISSPQLYKTDWNTPMVLGTASYTQLFPYCPLITYQLMDTLTNSVADGIFYFQGANIEINTNNPLKARTYNLKLVATTSGALGVYSQVEMPFTVIVVCCANTQVSFGQILNQKYPLGSGQMQIKPKNWKESLGYCGTFLFSISVSPTSNFIYFNDTLKAITVETYDDQDINKYNISLTGILTDGVFKTQHFELEVFKPINNPPYFDPEPKTQIIQAGVTSQYALPPIKDLQGDQFNSFVVLGPASAFISYISGKFILKPEMDNVGSYDVSITLNDHNVYNPMNQTYILTFKVSEGEQVADAFPGQVVGPISPGDSEHSAPSYNPSKGSNASLSSVPENQKMTAKIQQIARNGRVTIEFNCELKPIAKLSVMNQDVLQLLIVPGIDQDPANLAFNWTAVVLNSNQLILQISFENPIMVSQAETKDKLHVKFLNNQFFVDKATNQGITQNYIISKTIPLQLVGSSTTLATIGDIVSTGATTVTISNFVINLLMSGSLQFLWGMINTLQLIVHVPLFNLNFPANAQFLFEFIITVSKFDVIPEALYTKLYDKLDTSQPYESRSVSKNLGTLFLALIGLAIVVAFLIPLKLLARKVHLINKLYTKVTSILFYNMIIRIVLEGYLEFTLCSLLNLYSLDWSTGQAIFNSALAIGIMAATVLFPFVIAFLLLSKQDKLQSQSLKQRIGSLYCELKTDQKSALLFNALFIFRRLIFALSTTVLESYPFAQIQLLSLQCMLLIIYLGYFKPFQESFLNRLEIFNEICILTISYHLYLFTFFVEDIDLQYKGGWSIVMITSFNILANMAIVVIQGVKSMIQVFRRIKNAIRAKWFNRQTLYIDSSDSALQHSQNMYGPRQESRLQKLGLREATENPMLIYKGIKKAKFELEKAQSLFINSEEIQDHLPDGNKRLKPEEGEDIIEDGDQFAYSSFNIQSIDDFINKLDIKF